MAGAAYRVHAKDHAKTASGLMKDIMAPALAFTLPGILGGATDYFLSYDTSYFFAFGLGTSIYAAVKLAKPLFSSFGGSGRESAKVAGLIAVGFLCLYVAALFHA